MDRGIGNTKQLYFGFKSTKGQSCWLLIMGRRTSISSTISFKPWPTFSSYIRRTSEKLLTLSPILVDLLSLNSPTPSPLPSAEALLLSLHSNLIFSHNPTLSSASLCTSFPSLVPPSSSSHYPIIRPSLCIRSRSHASHAPLITVFETSKIDKSDISFWSLPPTSVQVCHELSAIINDAYLSPKMSTICSQAILGALISRCGVCVVVISNGAFVLNVDTTSSNPTSNARIQIRASSLFTYRAMTIVAATCHALSRINGNEIL